uniref:N-acetyltransferase domain-containing protein n=1 Tax=Ditylenchus dipsaci TaxID=166011 RepID=A0A915CZS8_9BILA
MNKMMRIKDEPKVWFPATSAGFGCYDHTNKTKRLVGFLVYEQKHLLNECYDINLDQFYVAKDKQQNGIGRMLMEHFLGQIDKLRKGEKAEIELNVQYEENQPAYLFYKNANLLMVSKMKKINL